MHPSRSRTTDLLILVAVAAVCCLPLLAFGIPKPSHDGSFHALALEHFATQLLSGDTYPRWMAGMNAGYGSPVFFFYPPVAYYAATLTSLLTIWTADPWLELGLALSLAVALSGLTFHLWIRQEVGRRAALAAAVIYMVAPYHLAIDTYMRGAYAEVWAFVWLPLVLSGVRAAGMRGAALTAAAVALLLMTHLPTSLLFAPVAVAYAVLIGWQRRSIDAPLHAAAGAILGAALAALYIGPALLLRDAVAMDTMSSGAFDVSRSFLFGQPVSAFKNQLAFMLTTMLGVVVVTEMIARRASPQGALPRRFWVAAGLVTYALMTVYARVAWDVLAPLRQVQFAWRLGTVLTLCVAAAVAFTLNGSGLEYRRLPRLIRFVFLPGIAAAWIGFSLYVMPPGELADWMQIVLDADQAPTEYRTPQAHMLWRTRTNNGRTLLPDAPRVSLVDGTGSVLVRDWQPRRIRLSTRAADSLTVEIRQLYFPGWHAASRALRPAIRPSPLGLVWLEIPPGEHDVTVRLAATRPEVIGARISLAALAIWLVLALTGVLRARRQPPAPGPPIAHRHGR